MSPDVPPEAEVIRLAREAMDMTAQSAAEASRAHDGRGVSAAYWRDVERGYGGRRGQRVPTRASARALAAMARVVGVTPAQLTGAGRGDAARVLEEILRRQDAGSPPAAPRPPARRYADDDDPVTAGYVREIHALLAGAMREHGPHFAPEDAFTEPHEIETWADLDGKMPDPEDRIRLMARIRRRVAELERQASNTGLARAPPAGRGFP